MKPTRIVVAALAALALVLGAGAAATAPDNAQAGNDSAGDAGPPGDLPDPVPAFVSGIYSTIDGFLDSTIENLGSAVSDLTPGGDEKPAPA